MYHSTSEAIKNGFVYLLLSAEVVGANMVRDFIFAISSKQEITMELFFALLMATAHWSSNYYVEELTLINTNIAHTEGIFFFVFTTF